jgi:AraC family transcriptional regulator
MGAPAISRPTGRLFRIAIKNMVCPRCVEAVRSSLTAMGLAVENVVLGQAWIRISSPPPLKRIDTKLRAQGFLLLTDRGAEITEQVKLALMDYLRAQEEGRRMPPRSVFLATRLGIPYRQLSRFFAGAEHTGVGQYYILLRIERVKELLTYNEATVSAIADRLGFSSVHHLSAQFKRVTGLSISDARPSVQSHRHPLDALR